MSKNLLALFALDQYIVVMTKEEIALIANGLWKPSIDDIVRWEEEVVKRKERLDKIFSRTLK